MTGSAGNCRRDNLLQIIESRLRAGVKKRLPMKRRSNGKRKEMADL